VRRREKALRGGGELDVEERAGRRGRKLRSGHGGRSSVEREKDRQSWEMVAMRVVKGGIEGSRASGGTKGNGRGKRGRR